IQDILPDNSTPKDSAEIVDRYINNWIRKQLLFSKAQTELTLDNPDIERKVEDYRYSLYIFELKEKMIASRLDTNINKNELTEYYKKEIQDFLLQETIFKGFMISVPKNSTHLKVLQSQFATVPFPLETIAAYCTTNQIDSKNSMNSWSTIDNFLMGTPFTSSNIQPEWKRGATFLSLQDKDFIYLLKITDLKLPMEPAPLEFIRSKLQAIILNKRKLAVANELEDQLYNEASKTNKVEIFR
ncbi:MAG: hypothetical protein K2Q22_12170, partial [Cytophagales bacterium]|nr:hypothetical protein [Cytophagales bacterium]